jgi:prepilin signal peptidase PulO-like enzyme (type II secretory pathway)
VRYGIVPDVFTLVPLLIVVGAGLLNGDPWPLISAFIAFVPFACLAIVSKGVGMGWGDVKLAALGGAVLGGETALLAFAIGAVVAVLWAYRRGRQKQVIAFAPFLAGAIAIAMPLATV